jgi:hypothetical protein
MPECQKGDSGDSYCRSIIAASPIRINGATQRRVRGAKRKNSFQRVTTKRGDHARHQPSGARAWRVAKRMQQRPSATYPKDMVIRAVLPTLHSLGVSGVCVTTHAEKTHAEKERTPRTLQVREPVARHGQANESRASTAIHSVGAWQHADRPSCQGMTAPLHSVTPRHHLVASPRGLCVFVPPSNVHQSQDSLILRLIRI